MAILRYILSLVLSILLSGCYEDFEPKIDIKPVLCINSLITAGEPIDVEVSRSWVYNNEDGENNHRVEDAKVSIYANGELQSDDYIPQEGDSIRIVAESRKWGNAEAFVIVPVAVPIHSVVFSPTVLDVWKDADRPMTEDLLFNMKFFMKILDTNSSDDYFNLAYNWTYQTGVDDSDGDFDASHPPYATFSIGDFEYNAEPIFREHMGLIESVFDDVYVGSMIFSDRQFPRKDYTLRLQFNKANYHVESPEYDPELYDCNVKFYLATVSRSFYDWSIYQWQRWSGMTGDWDEVGFADPIWGYSNVSSGAGVVAARSLSCCTINLKNFIQQTLNSYEYTEKYNPIIQ